jgi:hypothetical protein
MKLIDVAEFVPELHADAKFTNVPVVEAAAWWAERIKKTPPPGPAGKRLDNRARHYFHNGFLRNHH